MTVPSSSNEVTVAQLSKTLLGSSDAPGLWLKGKALFGTKAPVPHSAGTSDTYGPGTAANYGHVKLVSGDLDGATAADGSAASNAHTHGQYSPSTHGHTTSIAADSSSGTVVNMSPSTQYRLTAGGTSILFRTPANTSYEFDGTYNASTNKAATVSTVTGAINALSADAVGGTSRYISQVSQYAGKLSAVATVMDTYPTGGSHSMAESNGIRSHLDQKVDYRRNTDSTVIYNGAPFSDNDSTHHGCKHYFENGVTDDTVRMVYNEPGKEATVIFSKNGNYGSILKWGYADSYLYINGLKNGTWNNATGFDKVSAGYADSAGTVNDMAGSAASSNSNSRHVWFSNSDNETKRAYSDNLTYRTDTNTISANISGKSASVVDKGNSSKVIYSHWYGDNITKVEPSSTSYESRTGTKWLVGAYEESDMGHYNVVDVSNVTVGRCMKAYQDQNGNVIDTGYVKKVSLNVTAHNELIDDGLSLDNVWKTFYTWESKSSSTYALYTVYTGVTICHLSTSSVTSNAATYEVRCINQGGTEIQDPHTIHFSYSGTIRTVAYSLNCVGNTYRMQIRYKGIRAPARVKITHAYREIIKAL